MIETFYNTTAICLRNTTNTPTSSDSTSTVGSYLGIFRPLDEKDSAYIENNLGQGYCFITDENNDIKTADTLSVNSNLYSVQGVVIYTDLEDGSDSYIKAICTLS